MEEGRFCSISSTNPFPPTPDKDSFKEDLASNINSNDVIVFDRIEASSGIYTRRKTHLLSQESEEHYIVAE